MINPERLSLTVQLWLAQRDAADAYCVSRARDCTREGRAEAALACKDDSVTHKDGLGNGVLT